MEIDRGLMSGLTRTAATARPDCRADNRIRNYHRHKRRRDPTSTPATAARSIAIMVLSGNYVRRKGGVARSEIVFSVLSEINSNARSNRESVASSDINRIVLPRLRRIQAAHLLTARRDADQLAALGRVQYQNDSYFSGRIT